MFAPGKPSAIADCRGEFWGLVSVYQTSTTFNLGQKFWMLACSKMSYVLKLYVSENVWFDKSSGLGQRYDVIVQLMEMADIYNCGYQLFTNNLFITSMQQISFYVKEYLSLELCAAANWNISQKIFKCYTKGRGENLP